MRTRLVFLLLVLMSQILVAQIHDSLYDLSIDGTQLTSKNELIFEPIEIEIDLNVPFLNVVLELDDLVPKYRLEHYFIRYSMDAIHWSPYVQFNVDAHANDTKKHAVSALKYTNSKYQYFQLKLIGYNSLHTTVPTIRIFFEEHSFDNNFKDLDRNYRNECEQPIFQSRGEWCEEMECPINEGSYTDVTHLIVHHSAGISESSNWAAVVRSIWHYHVDVRGWDDIGYNWLIAPNGVIYEGRLDNIQGAHFCGQNGGTMGVCMLGNYENEINLNDTSRNALISLLAWKSFDQSIEPLENDYHTSSELDLYTISGHQDGCETLCPGQSLYLNLDSIRSEVNNILINCNPEIVESKYLLDCNLENTIAINELIFECEEARNFNYWIMDINGTVYKEGRVQDNKINVSDLDAKLYILRIESNDKIVNIKFLKIA